VSGVKLHTFVTPTLDGVSDELHAAATLPSRKEHPCSLNRRPGGPQVGLDIVAK
jgi:hypothetical protein